MASDTDPRATFDAALIPGMRARLAEGYARFRAAEARAIALAAPPEAGGRLGRYRTRDCPSCGGPAPDRAVLRNHGIDVVTCPACGLTYTRQVMEESADAARYQASELDIEAMRLRCSGPYLELEEARARYYLDLLEECSAGAGSLLDIGCGTGTTLVQAKARGWSVLGLEPGKAAAAVARERLGEADRHRVIEGYFPADLPADQQRFDAISILDVLEHFVDPLAFLHLVKRHLSPRGVLFVQVPNWDSLLVQLEGAASSVICTGHWTYFTPMTLPALLARAGFHALHVETVVSEIDRIASFPDVAKSAVVARLRPSEAGAAWPDDNGPLSATRLHRLGMSYKLIGIFAPEPGASSGLARRLTHLGSSDIELARPNVSEGIVELCFERRLRKSGASWVSRRFSARIHSCERKLNMRPGSPPTSGPRAAAGQVGRHRQSLHGPQGLAERHRRAKRDPPRQRRRPRSGLQWRPWAAFGGPIENGNSRLSPRSLSDAPRRRNEEQPCGTNAASGRNEEQPCGANAAS